MSSVSLYQNQTSLLPQANRGIAQGGFQRSALKSLLRGEPPASMRASVVCWRAACAAWGEPARPGLSPGGGNGKGGVQIPCCRRPILRLLSNPSQILLPSLAWFDAEDLRSFPPPALVCAAMLPYALFLELGEFGAGLVFDWTGCCHLRVSTYVWTVSCPTGSAATAQSPDIGEDKVGAKAIRSIPPDS